jgi:hypothetical protein
MNKKELELEYAKAKCNFRKSYLGETKQPIGEKFGETKTAHYWSGVCNTYRKILNRNYGKVGWDDKLYYRLYESLN